MNHRATSHRTRNHRAVRFGFVAGVWVCSAALALMGSRVHAYEIEGILPASFGLPAISGQFRRTPDGPALVGTDEFGNPLNLTLFFDTGASGLLLSKEAHEAFGIQPALVDGQEVTFEDVGLGGTTAFSISEPLYVEAASFNANTAANPGLNTFLPISDQPSRVQMWRTESESGLTIDVFGVPAMEPFHVVIDPTQFELIITPGGGVLGTFYSHLYEESVPYNPDPDQRGTNPGVPPTNLHIPLSYGSFDRFTQTTPADAPQVTLGDNPFIGTAPEPRHGESQASPSPKVVVHYQNQSADASFLLDTGSVINMISTDVAAQLGVEYVDDPRFGPGSTNPTLTNVPLDQQFQVELLGIGGSNLVAGFFLDQMMVPTVEGLTDPQANLNFMNAPVVVTDITLVDPDTGEQVVLDGIFGSNNYLISLDPDDPLGSLNEGPFDWVVYDTRAQTFGLYYAPAVPEPAVISMLMIVAVPAVFRRPRCRLTSR